jgi:hypothetical protein
MAAPSRPPEGGRCPVHGVKDAACPACLAASRAALPQAGDSPEEAEEKHVRRAEGIDEVLDSAGPDDV